MLQLSSMLLLFLKLLSVNGESSVHILAENLEQPITSTTLVWVPSSETNETTLKDAVIASYQLMKETKNESERDENEAVHIDDGTLSQAPVYVCRAKINSVWISGQLRPKERVCIVSLYKKVSEYTQFEVLISIEGSSRLSWVKKDKYTLIPQGAVTSGNGDNAYMTFIARRSNRNKQEGSLTHNVGKFLPNENLGVFHVVDENNTEIQFEDGEILVETEPIRYEFKNIKFDRYRGRKSKKLIELGHTVLKNEEDGLQLVDSVIGYQYNYSLNWGKGHGLLTGLPFTVFLPNGTNIQGRWALPEEKKVDEVGEVRRHLPEGTAVNVTLIGNYTESEISYVASVICIYKDEERRNITIRDTKREHTMLDIAVVYSPTYFLHNNSHVPTTTTTTTTTTASSTSKITSTTQEVIPIVSPENNNLSNEIDTEHVSKRKPNGDMLDDHTNQSASSLLKKDTKEPNGGSLSNMFSVVTILIVSLIICRVT